MLSEWEEHGNGVMHVKRSVHRVQWETDCLLRRVLVGSSGHKAFLLPCEFACGIQRREVARDAAGLCERCLPLLRDLPLGTAGSFHRAWWVPSAPRSFGGAWARRQ